MRTIQALEIQDVPQSLQLPPAQVSLPLATSPEGSRETFDLRDYQADLLDRLHDLWATGTKRVLLQLATGGGKTICLATVIDRALTHGQTCLVVVHREELLTQTIAKVAAITGQAAGILGISPTMPARYKWHP
jgi:superfamily II DNA or RNA helicase